MASVPSNKGRKVRWWTTFLLIAAIAAVYLGTIREGHVWGDDFALFVLHARNIALGLPYSDTAYLYNPEYPDIGPKTAPPVFPLLLAPVYRFAGLNIRAMKMEEIGFLLVALVCVTLLFAYFLPFPHVLAIVVVLALNPLSFYMKDQILTDVAFFLFCYLALFLITRAEAAGESSRHLWLPLSVLIYLAYGTRILGAVLLVALVVAYLISRRIPGRTVILTAVVSSILIGVQTLMLQGTVTYKDNLTHAKGFGFTPAHLESNLVAIQWVLRHQVWLAGSSAVLSWALLVLLLALAGRGFYIRVRGGVSCVDVFAVLYLIATATLPPSEDPRYLYPLLPLWLFYVATALSAVAVERTRIALGGLILAVIAASYVSAYRTADLGPIAEGIGDPGFRTVCAYLTEHAPAKAVFIFTKPRILGLMTDHPTAAVSPTSTFDEMKSYLNEVHARFVITTTDFPEDQRHWDQFAAANAGTLRKMLGIRSFVVYQVEQP